MVLLTAFSCRSLEEYNQSPNQIPVGTARPADMMDEILCNGATNLQQRFYDTFAEIMQYTCVTSSSNEVICRYYFAPSYVENCWDNFSKWAANADHMYTLALPEDGEEPTKDQRNYQAIALTLKAYFVDLLVSTFGYIPYSEAFQIRDGVTKPKFDSPYEIYTQVIKDLEKANDLYYTDKNLSNPSKDKIYGGNTTKWRKFTNSLRLRLLMRLSLRSTEMEIVWGKSVAQKIKEIIDNPSANPVMTSYRDNAVVYFDGDAPFQNPWGAYTESTLAGHRMTENTYDLLKAKNDPRLWIWFMPYSSGYGWIGIESGVPGDDVISAGYSVMNFQIMNNYKLPMSFMNYDEVCFLIAEAYARNDDEHWQQIVGTEAIIREWYNKGIRASCEFWRYIYTDWLGYSGRFITLASSSYYRNFTALEPVDLALVDEDGNPTGTIKHYDPVMTDQVIDDYLISEPVALDMRNPIKSIIYQKYIACFRICLEGWCDYRRTGYPELKIGSGTYNNHVLPYRLVYPSRTKTTNPDNYQAVLAKLAATYYDGADNMLTPIWWSEAALQKEIR